jgi:hypothetical protein
MDHAIEKIRAALATSKHSAVLSSFGKDSVLLLDLVRSERPDTPVIWFRVGVDERYAKWAIGSWNLTVFHWHPASVYTLRKGSDVSMVHEYHINGAVLPVVVDLRLSAGSSEFCGTLSYRTRTPNFFLPFDTLFVGWKDHDTHWVKGDAPLRPDGYTLGGAKLIAPLRHLTDDAVRAAIHDRKIPFTPTPDELPVCRQCLSGRGECIHGGPVPPTMDLLAFRQRFDLEVQ